MELTVIIPVYNSENSLLELGMTILETIPNITDAFEIIFVDDGSSDNCPDIIEKLNREDRRAKGIVLKRNSGQHVAVFTGLHFATGIRVLLMDDDMIEFAKYIPAFWIKSKKNWDLISGVRLYRQHDNLLRYNATKVISKLIMLITRQHLNDATSPLKLFKLDNVKELLHNSQKKLLIPEYLMMKGGSILEIPVILNFNEETASRYSFAKVIHHFFMLLITFRYVLFGNFHSNICQQNVSQKTLNINRLIGLLSPAN